MVVAFVVFIIEENSHAKNHGDTVYSMNSHGHQILPDSARIITLQTFRGP